MGPMSIKYRDPQTALGNQIDAAVSEVFTKGFKGLVRIGDYLLRQYTASDGIHAEVKITGPQGAELIVRTAAEAREHLRKLNGLVPKGGNAA
jgi:hypothetical protein